VNGQVVSVINSRHPQKVDISKYLFRDRDNLIAIRVKAYTSHVPMLHAPDDRNIGWFLGRTKLILSAQSMITMSEVYTKQLDSQKAIQSHKIQIQYPKGNYFKGSLEINY